MRNPQEYIHQDRDSDRLLDRLRRALTDRMQPQIKRSDTSKPLSIPKVTTPEQAIRAEEVHFASSGAVGIVDLGASTSISGLMSSTAQKCVRRYEGSTLHCELSIREQQHCDGKAIHIHSFRTLVDESNRGALRHTIPHRQQCV